MSGIHQYHSSLFEHQFLRFQKGQGPEGDIEAQLRKIAEESGQDYDRISKYYLKSDEAKQSLEEQIREEKVVELIASKAIITEKSKEEISKNSTSAI